MLLIPNLGAEQPLVNSDQLDTLRPFVLQAMQNLVQNSKAQESRSQPQALTGCDSSYLPAELLAELPADGLFAFINTRDVVELARREGRPLIGSANALSFHSRDWLFNYQSAQKDPWLDVALAYEFDTYTRDDIIELASTRVSQHPSLQQNRTWKPFLSASASGRCAGQGAELGQDEIQFIKNSQSTGLCLEPWVKRTRDYSSQFWLTESEIYWLSSTYQIVTPAGRYRGLETTRQLNRTPNFQPDDPIFSLHRALALELKRAGYSGPLGIDGFDYEGHNEKEHRAACEINARLTMAHLLLGMAVTRNGDETNTRDIRLLLKDQIVE